MAIKKEFLYIAYKENANNEYSKSSLRVVLHKTQYKWFYGKRSKLELKLNRIEDLKDLINYEFYSIEDLNQMSFNKLRKMGIFKMKLKYFKKLLK